MKIPKHRDIPQFHIPQAPKMKPIQEIPEIPMFILDKVMPYMNNSAIVKSVCKRRAKKITDDELSQMASLINIQDKK